MHLYPLLLAVVTGVMLEGGEVEIGAELAVDARQQIEIEFRGNTPGIVISGTENLDVLDQIDADDKDSAGAERVCRVVQEFCRFMRLESTDGRARKRSQPAAAPRSERGSRRRACSQRRRDARPNAENRAAAAPPRLAKSRRKYRPAHRPRYWPRRRAGCALCGSSRRRIRSRRNRAETARRSQAHAGATARSRSGSRIIFRQMRDALEQRRAGKIVEIFRRQPFGLGRKAFHENHRSANESAVSKDVAPRGARFHTAVAIFSSRGSQCWYFASRSPENCQRACG